MYRQLVYILGMNMYTSFNLINVRNLHGNKICFEEEVMEEPHVR